VVGRTHIAGDLGAVFVFERVGGSWTLAQEVEGSWVDFGQEVRLEGERLATTSGFYEDERWGRVWFYRFRGGRFRPEGELIARNQYPDDWMGRALELHIDAKGRELVFSGSPNSGADFVQDGSVLTFEVPPLLFEASPRRVEEGDTLTFEVCGGRRDGPMLVEVTAIDGNPVDQRVFLDRFGGEGRVERSFRVPPGLAGLRFTFQAHGEDRESRRLGSSPKDRVRFR
jgi:hypothetical protein